MGTKEYKLNTDVGEGALIFGIFLMIICFYGEPDLIDALINYLMRCGI